MPLSAPWTEQRAVASDGAARAWFGSSVAASGAWTLIGARNANIGADVGTGAVYVFWHRPDGWAQVQKLTGKGADGSDQFGVAIAMHGDLALVTAPYAEVDGIIWRGVVHVFRREPTARMWKQTQKLEAHDVPIFGTLGISVATNGEYAFAGAGGATQGSQHRPYSVHIFKHTEPVNDGWTRTQVLDSPTPADPNSVFGGALACTADTLVVGARGTTIDGRLGQGAVYVYSLSNGLWTLSAKITAPDPHARDNFGVSVAIEGENLFVGAQGATSAGGGQGAVYRFERGKSGWDFRQTLVASNPQGAALFGAMVRARGNNLLVGAYAEDGYRGAAYVFSKGATGYDPVTRLSASDRAAGDVFGYYGDVTDTGVAIGAYPKAVDGRTQQGAAYFFSPAVAAPR